MGARQVDEETIRRWITEGIAANPGGSSYLVYAAGLDQSNTDAPVPSYEENTIGGTPSWSYDDEGYFNLTLTGKFPASAKIGFLWSCGQNDATLVGYRIDDNTFQIGYAAAIDGTQRNNMTGAYIEIKIWQS